MGRELSHSAEGTTWSKKNHKYIRKEGNRYIYPTLNPVKAIKNYNKRQELNKKLAEREIELLNRQYQANQAAEARNGIARREEAVRRNWRDQYTARNRQIIQEKKQKEAERRISENYNRKLLDKAEQNRRVSSNPSGRTAREQLSRRGVSRVAYANKTTPSGQSIRMRRQVSIGPNYDDHGFRKNSDISAKDTIVSRVSHAPSGNARDILSRKGVSRVRYTDGEDARRRAVINKHGVKNISDVQKNFGSKDTRSAFKRKVSDFEKKIGIGRTAFEKSILKRSKEAKKERKRHQREMDKQIPLSMRLKRDTDRGRKALAKFFNR